MKKESTSNTRGTLPNTCINKQKVKPMLQSKNIWNNKLGNVEFSTGYSFHISLSFSLSFMHTFRFMHSHSYTFLLQSKYYISMMKTIYKAINLEKNHCCCLPVTEIRVGGQCGMVRARLPSGVWWLFVQLKSTSSVVMVR